jgi:tetratricopeptide (TPR) repeat protein
MLGSNGDEGTDAVLATADVFIRFGRLEAAEKYLKSVTTDYSGDQLALVLTKLALVYELQGQFRHALQCLRQAVQNARKVADPGLCLAALLCDLGQYDDAKKCFSAAAGLDNGSEPSKGAIDAQISAHHLEIAWLYEHSGRTDESIRHLDAALTLTPHHSGAVKLRVRQLIGRKRPKDLLKFIEGPHGAVMTKIERDVLNAIALAQLEGVEAGHSRLKVIPAFGKSEKDQPNRRIAQSWEF